MSRAGAAGAGRRRSSRAADAAASPSLGALVRALQDLYPLHRAEDWDRVGLVLGVAEEKVSRVLLAVDPTVAVAQEAAAHDLLITHHPLLLRGASLLPAGTGKGSVVTTLLRSGTALWSGHTNVDRSATGTATALAAALDLTDPEPLVAPAGPEEGLIGLGLLGSLAEPTTVAQLARTLAGALPATVQGARFTGDAERTVRTVALCPGAGDSLLERVRSTPADVYVTSDLRHHTALEHLEAGADPAQVPALIDIPHWAAESLWLPMLREELLRIAAENGWSLQVEISARRTDPWTGVVPG
ncbi:Nif3-like dinuclear metal center hexameric protein [Brachybacterium phenoliresistens]|uniref:Nif3-like dinuclear metal center hexameric protein n=1 Tax=Brachybacterium phenoliresistens TaxID=396014 RepID=UPI0031CE70D6